MILTKEFIKELKENREFAQFINGLEDDKSKLFLLNNLGRLPSDFKGEWLTAWLVHKNPKIRLSTVQNIGKLKQTKFNSSLFWIAQNDPDTNVRREAVSAIGRQRNVNNKDSLFKLLNEQDPKIVMQVIRALLVFKNDKDVERQLSSLLEHPNEMIQDIVKKEFFPLNKDVNKKSHSSSPDFMKNVVVHGDVREIFQYIPDESIHLTFTSPPYYNARDYSIYKSYQEYLNFLDEVFKETIRVTKEGRFLIVNTSPVIIPRFSRAHASKRYPIPFDLHSILVKMAWEFIDDIVWVKPESSVKNRIGGFQQHRKPLAYKPNTRSEMVMVYRKKTDKLIDWNIKQYNEETVENSKIKENFETSNIWEIEPAFSKEHPAIFPVELCRRIIKFYSFKGDLVFDPFAGSGTLGRTAKDLERFFFLTEKEEEYFENMKKKMKEDLLSSERTIKFLTLETFEKLKNDADRSST